MNIKSREGRLPLHLGVTASRLTCPQVCGQTPVYLTAHLSPRQVCLRAAIQGLVAPTLPKEEEHEEGEYEGGRQPSRSVERRPPVQYNINNNSGNKSSITYLVIFNFDILNIKKASFSNS